MGRGMKCTIKSSLKGLLRRIRKWNDSDNYQWRVQYDDLRFSIRFDRSTAQEYASIFGGKVVYIRYKDPA